MTDTIYFISDLHLGKGRDERLKIKKLYAFFDYIVSKASALYIVGDFFDFYFEYKTQIPKKYYDVYRRLSNLVEKGIEIHYFIGNHDYWLGDFLESIGLKIHRTAEELTLQGKKVFITHGHGLITFDPGEVILKNKVAIGLFYLIHPDIAYRIASCISSLSRANSQRKDIRWKKLFSYARNILRNDADAVVMGHIHIPIHKNLDGKDFILIGDWIEHFTYAEMQGGRFCLKKFT